MKKCKEVNNKESNIVIIEKLITIYQKYEQVISYLFFGGLTFVISVSSYLYFDTILGFNELIANVFSWLIAVMFAFVTNRKWVFQASVNSKLSFIKQMLAFYGGRLFTLCVEEFILFVFITYLGMMSLIIKMVAQIVVIILNYFISKQVIFKQQTEG